MFKCLLDNSLANRLLVIIASLVLMAYGAFTLSRTPVDVFPDLNKPTVTIMTESGGMAAEEVEQLITFPLETTMNGLPGVESVRSVSSAGLSFIYVTFNWKTEIFRARQMVSERLSSMELRLDVTKMRALQDARITPRAIQNPRSWQQRLGLIMHYPHTQSEVEEFIGQQVQHAFSAVQKEFQRRQLDVTIQPIEQGLQLRVDHHNEINFVYQVVARETQPPSFMADRLEEQQFYQAEVFLREGGQNYDVMDWTLEDLLQDIIDQYERHLHFLNLVRATN